MIHQATAPLHNSKFQGITFKSTPKNLIEILGDPDYYKTGDITLGWVKELSTADVFLVFFTSRDNVINENEEVDCKIKSENRFISETAKKEILNLFEKKL